MPLKAMKCLALMPKSFFINSNTCIASFFEGCFSGLDVTKGKTFEVTQSFLPYWNFIGLVNLKSHLSLPSNNVICILTLKSYSHAQFALSIDLSNATSPEKNYLHIQFEISNCKNMLIPANAHRSALDFPDSFRLTLKEGALCGQSVVI